MGSCISLLCCHRKKGACLGDRPSARLIDRVHSLDPTLRHDGLRSFRAEGVGDWLLRTEEFVNWNISEGEVVCPVLFCYGDPGVGKTHIWYGLTLSWENGGD